MNDDRVRIFVTGANRGLGLEFARQWSAAGARVFASCRSPEEADDLRSLAGEREDRVTIVRCEVADDGSVAAAADSVAGETDGLEIVVNNAGIPGGRGGLEELDVDDVRRAFETNTLGPLRVSRAFVGLLRRGREPRRLIHVTSLMGSIDDNRSGGSYPYRLSKCALNMASRNMAHDFEADRIVSVVVHPGWVKTRMGGPNARSPVDEAVSDLIGTIESLTMEESGGFFDRHGEPLPW